MNVAESGPTSFAVSAPNSASSITSGVANNTSSSINSSSSSSSGSSRATDVLMTPSSFEPAPSAAMIEARANVERAVALLKLDARKPLTVTVKGSTQQLLLVELSVSIVGAGKLVEATFEMVWFNDGADDVEGELQFPLEQGATVCGYAVDIDGAMVSGVIVGKEKARAVFEEEVREHKSAPGLN